MRILGIGGSMREGSRSAAALRAALELAEGAGARTVLADVRGLRLPVYDPDLPLGAYPPELSWLLDEVRAADAYILCSPTYHGTVAGGVKNALDALNFLGGETPRYLGGKVVGLMALGAGSANVLNALHHTARALNGLSAPAVVSVPDSAMDPETGWVRDEAVRKRLKAMTDQVIELTRRLRAAPVGV